MSFREQMLAAARKAAEVLRDLNVRGRIDAGYTRIDPMEVAGSSGVTVMLQPLDKLLGGFLREETPGIIINVDRPYGLVNMTCAHELGHFFLGHETTADLDIGSELETTIVEKQANQFAYSLLAPTWLITRTCKAKSWRKEDLQIPATVYQLSLRLGISYSAMAWMLNSHNYISEAYARALVAISPASLKDKIFGGGIPHKSESDVWVLDESDRNLLLEPRAGDHFVLDLPSHAAAGYLWSLDEAASEGFHISPQLIDGSSGSSEDFGTVVGLESRMRYVLSRDKHAGLENELQASVLLAEKQPWSGGRSVENSAYGFDAEYRALSKGLTKQSKNSLLSMATNVG